MSVGIFQRAFDIGFRTRLVLLSDFYQSILEYKLRCETIPNFNAVVVYKDNKYLHNIIKLVLSPQTHVAAEFCSTKIPAKFTSVLKFVSIEREEELFKI